MDNRFQGTVIAFLWSLGFVFSGYFIGKSLQRFVGDNKVINVRGIDQREVKANYGVWQINFWTAAPTVPQAIQSFKKSNQIIKDFLTQNNFSDKEISVGAPTVSESHGETDKNKVKLWTGLFACPPMT